MLKWNTGSADEARESDVALRLLARALLEPLRISDAFGPNSSSTKP